jgi:hypothetical protein
MQADECRATEAGMMMRKSGDAAGARRLLREAKNLVFEGERWTEKVIGRYGTKISLAAETESPGVGPPEMT